MQPGQEFARRAGVLRRNGLAHRWFHDFAERQGTLGRTLANARLFGVVASIILSTSTSLGAGKVNMPWQELNQLCLPDTITDPCDFFLWGAYAATVLHNADEPAGALFKFCLPESGITNKTALAVIRQWIDKHPANWHLPTAGLVAIALHEAYPCPA